MKLILVLCSILSFASISAEVSCYLFNRTSVEIRQTGEFFNLVTKDSFDRVSKNEMVKRNLLFNSYNVIEESLNILKFQGIELNEDIDRIFKFDSIGSKISVFHIERKYSPNEV